jgi:hypothetical protein
MALYGTGSNRVTGQKQSVRQPRLGHSEYRRDYWGRAMSQAVSRRPLTAEARVGPCGICGGQSGTYFIIYYLFSPVAPCGA